MTWVLHLPNSSQSKLHGGCSKRGALLRLLSCLSVLSYPTLATIQNSTQVKNPATGSLSPFNVLGKSFADGSFTAEVPKDDLGDLHVGLVEDW